MKRELTEVPVQSAVYSAEQVAHLLQTTTWNVYEWIKAGEIPGAWSIGKKYRVLRSIFNRAFGIDGHAGASAVDSETQADA